MKFPFYLASLVSSYELPRFDVLDEYSRHTAANNYTLSTKGCPCFYDNSRKEDCPCCRDEGACPCSWPYDDRCGDCITGHGCVPEPINKETVSDRGCKCQDGVPNASGSEFLDRTCACCYPHQNTCPCAYPYQHMCADCAHSHDCSRLKIAAQYQSLYPSYFEVEERNLRMRHDWDSSVTSGVCEALPLTLENGFVLCDKEPKDGKSCVWFCNKNYELEGVERAACVCSGLNCYWNDNANFEPPVCHKNYCAPNPCGAGTCKTSGEEYICSCPIGHFGERCELPDVSFGNNHLIADDSGISSFFAGREDNDSLEQSDFGRRDKNRLMDLQNKRCPQLEPGPNGNLKCTAGNQAASSCFLTCNDGYQVNNKKFAAPTCNCNNHRCYWDRRRHFKLAMCFDWPSPIGDNVNDAIIDTGEAEELGQRISEQIKKTCLPLVVPKFGSMKCTHTKQGNAAKAEHDTVCRFACKKGYGLSIEGPATCLCDNGVCHWNQEEFYTEPLCQDRDECTLAIDNCDQKTNTCINKPGSFVCLENDSPILRECDDRPCGRGGDCEITANGYRCRCNDGFRQQRGTCRDINECDKKIDKCFDDAICENEIGSYSCKCPSGYGDGISECVPERTQLSCIQKRSLRYDPMPTYVAPNACCEGIPFNTDLRCCCNGRLHPITVDDCPCLKIDYKNVL